MTQAMIPCDTAATKEAATRPRVALAEDDFLLGSALQERLSERGMSVYGFSRAASLLEALGRGLVIDCIVSDIRMPELTGLDLQRELANRNNSTPLILITAYGEVELAVTALKQGAHDFLLKPVWEQRLIASIESAVDENNRRRSGQAEIAELKRRVAELSERQRQVMELAVQGRTNKEIAMLLKISFRTVENYRAWVMERMGADNLADLVRMAARIGL